MAPQLSTAGADHAGTGGAAWYERRMPSRMVLYMAASAFGFSVMSLLVKVASETLPMGEIVLARAVVTLALSWAMLARADLPTWGKRKGRLVLRGLLGFGGLSCFYVSLSHLPLADAATLQNLTPLVTTLLAWWLLRERVGWSAAFALACGLGGVLLIVHPSGSGLDPLGVVFGLCAVACSSLAYVTVRKLAATEHMLVIVFYFPLVATPLAIPWALADWVTPTFVECLLLLGIGIATQIGQFFITLALSLERAGRAATAGYLQIVFAMIWQTMIFHDAPALLSLAGAALIILGTLAVLPRNQAPPLAR